MPTRGDWPATYTAQISWGDGTSSAATVSARGAGFAVTGSHTYRNRGTYTATVLASDVGGATATTTTRITVS